MVEIPLPEYGALADNPEANHLLQAEIVRQISENADLNTALKESVDDIAERIDALEAGSSAPRIYYKIKKDKQTIFPADTWIDVDGLSVEVTLETGQDALINGFLSFGVSVSGRSFATRATRDGVVVAEGDAAGVRAVTATSAGGAAAAIMYSTALSVLDEAPGVGTFTYKLQARADALTVILNSSNTDSDTLNFFRGVCTMTVLPVDKQ